MSVDAFKPEIWSQELRAAYEKALVFVSLCNRDYEGEIAKAGDIVHINTIGDPTVADYVPGTTQISAEELATSDQTLLIDQCKYFAFKVDDVDKRQAAGEILTKGMQRSAYKMKDAADQYVAGLYVGAHAGNVIDTVHIADGDAAYEQLIDLGVLLDEANVSEEGRNCIAPPWFFGLLVTSNDWSDLAASGWHSFAVKSSDRLWAWGQNNGGQLGLGDTIDRWTPTPVGGP